MTENTFWRRNIFLVLFVVLNLNLESCILTQKSYSLKLTPMPSTPFQIVTEKQNISPQVLPPQNEISVFHAGINQRTLSYGSLERTFTFYIPASYDENRPTALVFIFHGYGLDGETMMRVTGFNEQAEKSGFILVYPLGSGQKPSWNAGTCCGEAQKNGVDDVGFIRALLREMKNIVWIDATRIYATGFSNGAMFSYRLACELSAEVAAIAPVSATQSLEDCHPKRPVSVLHFHGTNDRLNPYDGLWRGTKQVYLPVSDSIQFWVNQNGCAAQPKTEKDGNITHTMYSPCQDKSAVELYTINAGEHAWPGGGSVTDEIGKPTTEISATVLIWAFFSAHPK